MEREDAAGVDREGRKEGYKERGGSDQRFVYRMITIRQSKSASLMPYRRF